MINGQRHRDDRGSGLMELRGCGFEVFRGCGGIGVTSAKAGGDMPSYLGSYS